MRQLVIIGTDCIPTGGVIVRIVRAVTLETFH